MAEAENEINENKIEPEENKEESLEEEDYEKEILNKTFFNKYKCIKKLGEGSFGMIYKAEFENEYYALKIEHKNSINLLENEAQIMSILKGPNIPYVKSYGYSGNFNILVMQLLGKSLEDIFEERKNFSLKSVCMLANQMITVLEYIHNKHFIHRDIKPDNFVMGLEDKSQYVYLLDFGLAKKYRSSTTLIQNPMINKKKLTGTARYASINALKGFEQSRRDDLESVGYVLMYLLRGSLPWQGFQAKTKEERYKKILKKKIDVTSYDLCIGFPNEFEKFVEYTRRLEYTEEPKYDFLRELFNKVMKREQFKFDFVYDWTTKYELKLRNTLTLKTEADSQNNHYNIKRGWSIKAQYKFELEDNNVTLYKSNNYDNVQGNKDLNRNREERVECCNGCLM